MTSDDETPELHSCGYIEDTFACRIRHMHMNTGAANSNPDRWARAAEQHNKHFH